MVSSRLVRAEISAADEVPAEDLGLIEVILARMVSRQVSLRSISASTGIKRGRAHNILHRDATKRHSMRLDEESAILRALDIGILEATLAAGVLSAPEMSRPAAGTVAIMLSNTLNGLPGDIIRLVDTIEGVDHTDIRPEHGLRLRAIVLGFLEKHYTAIGVRRLDRTRDMDAF